MPNCLDGNYRAIEHRADPAANGLDVRLILQVTHPLRTLGLLDRVFFSLLAASGGESLLDLEPLVPLFPEHAAGSALRSGSIWIFGALIDQIRQGPVSDRNAVGQ